MKVMNVCLVMMIALAACSEGSILWNISSLTCFRLHPFVNHQRESVKPRC